MNLNPKTTVAAMLVVGVLLLGVCVVLRRSPTRVSASAVRAEGGARVKSPPTPVFTPAKKALQPLVGQATETARVRSTYQNFRTAVAVGNAPLRDALRAVLKKDGETALRIAREDVDRSSDPGDREIALKALDALNQ